MSETSKLWTLDQLLRQRAIDEDQTPLIAFPRTRQGYTDYEPVTGATLNHFVDGTAKCLIEKGFQPVLSPRLPPSAVKELLAKIQNGRRALLYTPAHTSFKLDALSDLELFPLVQRDEYDNSRHSETPEFLLEGVDYEKEHSRRCLILHSSGSTGLPKPIDYNHQKLLAAGVYAQDATAFISMPFSHALGMMSYMQAIHKRGTIYAMSGYVPQTHDTVTAAVKAANPEIMWTVPYILKLLAEKPDGIDAIKNCRFVSSGGSKLPDELGDMLTEAGVHIGMQFGSYVQPLEVTQFRYGLAHKSSRTETGLILSSAYRDREDKAWNYLRPPAHVVPYIMFKPVDHDKYECVVLDGHKGKTMSNSDDPPNSWRTSDLFVPHPSLPNAWKFVGRLDDRITLINGEKVLPLSIEARIKQSPLVREAVVFGIGREVPGLLLFRELGTSHLDDKEFLNQVWPTIEYANSHSESFSQINREMVTILPMDVECPLTDKNSIKRGLIYEQFADLIDSIYAAAESSNKVQSLQLTILELENWILEHVRARGYEIEDVTTDFFTAVFDCGNTQRLARRLHAIRTGDNCEDEKDMAIHTMKLFIEKYGTFAEYKRNVNRTLPTSLNGDHVVILTGVTGFLGAHILAALVASSSVSKVYAFMRPNSEAKQTPLVRLERSLQAKGFSISLNKVIPLYADITEENFGLKTAEMYKTMKLLVTHVIHCAWAVNFAIQLTAFEPQLLGTAQATPGTATIASAMLPSFDSCSSMGYSQSKLVGEHIVESATKNGANATVLRIGQIIPGRRRGSKLWNPSEATPLMIRSASKDSTGALPILDTGRDTCDWIEADTLADTILQLAGIDHEVDSTELVYNLVNPRVFSWKDDLLPSLHRAGLKFDTIPWQEWLDRLEASKEDANTNPSRKLLGFWRKQTHRDGALIFDTAPAEAASPALRESLRVVDDNFVGQIIETWKKHETAAKAH
uniref:Linear gramicidin synthase subunit D n=1 Tax=Talaromyces marneffei PM1 TaxID=1077442 RepID=A0A093XI25_TALMA